MLLKDDHEEKRRKSIKRERRKVREKGGKEAQMQMENIKMYEKTEKSEKTGKQKAFFGQREELSGRIGRLDKDLFRLQS